MDERRGADAIEERPIRRAAPQEHMLAVVEPQPVALERPRQSAEAGAPLDEDHVGAPVGSAERGGESGEAGADDHDSRRHALPIDTARAATASFSDVGSEMRPRSTTLGSSS